MIRVRQKRSKVDVANGRRDKLGRKGRDEVLVTPRDGGCEAWAPIIKRGVTANRD